MYNQQQIVNINDYDELKPEFFNCMFEAEQKYYKVRDEQSMKELLCYYTDCISYFEIKQESISSYFQQKIKELVREIKQFGTQQLAEKNKEKMSKNIIRVMQEENIQEKITSTIKKQQKINEAVNKILQEQNQKLERRLLKSKRTMSKCQSVTMSFASIDSSPDLKPAKPRVPLNLTTKFLFTKDIGYSDEENSTS